MGVDSLSLILLAVGLVIGSLAGYLIAKFGQNKQHQASLATLATQQEATQQQSHLLVQAQTQLSGLQQQWEQAKTT